MVAHHLVSRIGASPLWRAGLASVFILGLAGVAAGVIPEACRTGVFACGVSSDAPPALELADAAAASGDVSSSAAPAPSVAPVTQSSAVAAETTSVPPAAPTLVAVHEPASITGNDLIAATFSALDFGLVTPTGELNARKVKTVSIGADGQPLGETSVAEVAPLVPQESSSAAAADSSSPGGSEASSSEEPSSEPSSEPVVESSSSARVEVASAELSSEDVGAVGYAPTKGGTALVTGKGANVRSKPQKGGSEVLFALAGGAEVTVVEMRKGWAKVVDERGRSGWIYGDYLRR